MNDDPVMVLDERTGKRRAVTAAEWRAFFEDPKQIRSFAFSHDDRLSAAPEVPKPPTRPVDLRRGCKTRTRRSR